ncbi:hypothetical protein ACLB9X_05800 [Streptomyces sp. 5K101]|uniref:hypothetical protein n=1 Tax=Streptomyces sp. 5K101 TaxID=3390037 RepID=UPI003974A406
MHVVAVPDDRVTALARWPRLGLRPLASCSCVVGSPLQFLCDGFRLVGDLVDEAPEPLVFLRPRQVLAPDDETAAAVAVGGLQDHEEALDFFDAVNLFPLDAGPVREVDVAAFDDVVRHGPSPPLARRWPASTRSRETDRRAGRQGQDLGNPFA